MCVMTSRPEPVQQHTSPLHAIRNRADVRAKAHVDSGQYEQRPDGTQWPVGVCGTAVRDAERVPLDRTAEEDRCKACNAKENHV